MIYLYYDKNGVLKEIINNKASRKGSANINGFAVYCEIFDDANYTISDIWYVQQFPDKTKSTEISFIDGAITETIPYDKENDYRYFKDFTVYKFYKFTFTDNLLSQNGLNIGTIRLALNDGDALFALGLFTFNIEDNIVKNDNYITQSQYDYLVQLFSNRSEEFDNIHVKKHAYINNLDLSGKVIGNFSPYEDNKYDLGSSTKQWQDLHLAGRLRLKGKEVLGLTNSDELFLRKDNKNLLEFDEGKLDISAEKAIAINGGNNKAHIFFDTKNSDNPSTSWIELDNSKIDIYDTNEIRLRGGTIGSFVKIGGNEAFRYSNQDEPITDSSLFAVNCWYKDVCFGVASNGTAYYNGYEILNKEDKNELTARIDEIDERTAGIYHFLGTYSATEEPTSDKLSQVAKETFSHDPLDNGDTIMWIYSHDNIETIYTCIYSNKEWQINENPALQKASDSTYGIIKGNSYIPYYQFVKQNASGVSINEGVPSYVWVAYNNTNNEKYEGALGGLEQYSGNIQGAFEAVSNKLKTFSEFNTIYVNNFSTSTILVLNKYYHMVITLNELESDVPYSITYSRYTTTYIVKETKYLIIPVDAENKSTIRVNNNELYKFASHSRNTLSIIVKLTSDGFILIDDGLIAKEYADGEILSLNSSLSSQIASEVTRATNTENTLENDLSNEKTTRANNDTQIQTNLSKEIQERKEQDTTLQGNIDRVEKELSEEIENHTSEIDTWQEQRMETLNGYVSTNTIQSQMYENMLTNIDLAITEEDTNVFAYNYYINSGMLEYLIDNSKISFGDSVTSSIGMFVGSPIKVMPSGLPLNNITNVGGMFALCYDLLSIGQPLTNTTITQYDGLCFYCYNLREINWDLSGATDLSCAFEMCEKLKATPSGDLTNCLSMEDAFKGCKSLETFNFTNIGCSFDLSDCVKLSHDTLVNIIATLQTTTNSPTLTLGTTLKSLLSDNEIKVATDKGWTIE